jgi:integrase
LSEIQTLKWDYIADDIHLPASKTGARKVYLNEDARAVLSNLTRLEDNPYVIHGKEPGCHLTDMQKPWRRIRIRAGLEDVRIHDLRHTFASVAIGRGASLPIIGKLLGHSQPQSTARYAHLADDPMKAAAELVGASMRRERKEETIP